MSIESITLSIIKMPLKQPFVTHLETVSERESLVIQVNGKEGVTGYGECVAFSSPWYTEETVQTSWHMLNDFLIPLLKREALDEPAAAARAFRRFRGNNMAKASIEGALWDLKAKRMGLPLGRLLGGSAQQIPSGAVAAAKNLSELVGQTETLLAAGYKRIKIKISPGKDIEPVRELRKRFPQLDLMADANSAYSLNDIGRLKELDEFGLLMIEQPLGSDDIIDHSLVQREISTPICLDESIRSFEDARKAIELGSCQVINIKAGRVGGISEAIKIHDFCLGRGIPVWCGGMVEFGISRAQNIALASLPGFTIAGDISASSRFWEEDIISPEVTVNEGMIDVPDGPGIGFQINEKRLKECMVQEERFIF